MHLINYPQGLDKDITDTATVFVSGQTTFSLTRTPLDPQDVAMFVNGVRYTYGTNFTVSGVNVYWLDTPFTLDMDEEITFTYAI